MPSRSSSSWALVRGARSTWSRFRSSASALPRSVWATWLGTLALGLGVSVLAAFGVVAVGRRLAEQGMRAWDERLLRRLVEEGPFTFDQGIWWESLGSSALLVPLLLTAMVLAARARRPLLALTFPVVYAGIKLLVFSAWAVWDRARPEFVQDGIAAPGLNAYPSGHAVNVAVVYGLLTYLWVRHSNNWAERGLAVLLCLALVAVVGTARLRLGTHWPSDVIAGIVIGAAWLAALIVALQRAEARRPASEEHSK